jgi:Domain of unknown function (DUF4288)
MAWFAAHIISYVEFQDGVQDKYPVWENIVLIEANSAQEASGLAQKIGIEEYDDPDGSEGLYWEDRPARWVFAGIRKIIESHDTASTTIGRGASDHSPTTGTEVSYSQLQVGTREALDALVAGDPVELLYEE